MGKCLFVAASSMPALERRRPPLKPASFTSLPSSPRQRGGLRSPTNRTSHTSHISHISPTSLTSLTSPGSMTITPRRVQPQRLRKLYVPLISRRVHFRAHSHADLANCASLANFVRQW
ncbi:hypothetical protein IscW_ISCW024542 [Ixodes scapularis]|uniref:Uncharacterized protein n=1 Tax=Ixodes scapularis TaxID=6945 RepID=B7Q012_IXOSC|nr:hypothetical protein IscW_ISCW024542 [Ixodes scapularis]|eukprot:XP_002406696.1 hypothetical protein IscW_ISCW024542 [Ixodes scapularis]